MPIKGIIESQICNFNAIKHTYITDSFFAPISVCEKCIMYYTPKL